MADGSDTHPLGYIRECETCGYEIWVDDNYVGGSSKIFFDQETFTFPVPYLEDRPCGGCGNAFRCM